LFEVIIIRRRLSGMPPSVLGRRFALMYILPLTGQSKYIMQEFTSSWGHFRTLSLGTPSIFERWNYPPPEWYTLSNNYVIWYEWNL